MSRSLAAVLLALLYVLPGHFVPAAAQTPDATLRHAIAKIGEPQVPKGFTHFEWVNPTAPKGGTITLSTIGNFDNLNPYTFKGYPAPAISLLDATLMAPSLDEPATTYGLDRGVDFGASGPLIGDVRHPRLGALQRRTADHARGCHLLARGAEEGASGHRAQLQGHRRRPKRRASGR